MFGEMNKYFEIYPETPIGRKGSVHYGYTNRIDQAKQQMRCPRVSRDTVIALVNEFLKAVRMSPVNDPVYSPQEIDYAKIKDEYSLANENDIVWMKFIKNEDSQKEELSWHLGVVAASADVNFEIPTAESQYNEEVWSYKYNRLIWKYNTTGILIHQLEKEWDTTFVLIFPLANIPAGYNQRSFERAIGNYLIEKGVPIIDFWSHNYQIDLDKYGKVRPRRKAKKDISRNGDEFSELEGDKELEDDIFCLGKNGKVLINGMLLDEVYFDMYPNSTFDDENECFDGYDY